MWNPTKFDYPFSLARQFGVFSSNIRTNSVGDPDATLLRHGLTVFDNNAFVTLWVVSILLEVARFTDDPILPDCELSAALEAIGSYHDRNHPMQDGILVFWPETFNASAGMWHCSPQNLGPISSDEVKILDVIHKILNDLGLERLWDKIPELLRNM